MTTYTGSITVVDANRTEAFNISATMNKVRQAVARFVGRETFDGLSIRLNSAVLAPTQLDEPLVNEDTIFVTTSNIQTAGFKGA